MNYFEIDELIEIHDFVIEVSGGLAGVKDKGRLLSVLEHIKNDIYYPTFIDKLNHLVFSIAANHSFNAGNKRSAILAGVLFLKINDVEEKIQDRFIIYMEFIILMLIEKTITKEEMQEFINKIINNQEFNQAQQDLIFQQMKKDFK